MLDSQRIVDNKIKHLCELFIDYSVRLILRRLQLVRNQLMSYSKVINSNESATTKFKSVAGKETQSDTAAPDQIDAQQTGGSVENRMALPPAKSGEESSAQAVERQTNGQDDSQETNDSNDSNEEKSRNGVAEKRTNDTSDSVLPSNANEEEHRQPEQRTSAASEQCDQQQLSGVQQLANDLNELIREANEQVISVQKSMKIYLSSEDTEAILFKPVKNHIVKSIENLFSQLALVFGEQELCECPYTSPKAALEAIFRTNRTADRPNW